MSKISSVKTILENEAHQGLTHSKIHERKPSSNSSSDSESFFLNIKKDIKALLENDENLSISSNSEDDSQNKNDELDYLLESRFWKPQKNNEINKGKNNIKKEKGIREESNKQSTQENEDEEIRNEQINNNSSSESNNSPLNTFNEANDNERNFDKNINNYFNNEKKEEKNKINNNINIINNNNDKNNLNGTNILLNGSNFANNINYKNMNGYSLHK